MSSLEFFSLIFFIIIIFMVVTPMIKQNQLKSQRFKALQTLEKKRGSRVIALIHRQEVFSLLGFPLTRFIDIEDSEQIMRAIRYTPDDMPIDLILHTPGGLVLAADQIADALKGHPAKVTVFVPHYAMSGGTMIGLAADELLMDANAMLGPIDPQIRQYPAVSILKAVEQKDPNEIDDETLIFADISKKAIKQVREKMFNLLKDRYGDEKAQEIADTLTEGRWTHDYPLGCEEIKELGMQVCGEIPRDIYQIMDLFPQPIRRQPSVSYIPVPYDGDKHK